MGVLAKPSVSSDALVLRFWPCGESSGIASLLTRDEGFVKVMAKGVRRPQSKLRSLVEPGRLVQAEFSLDPQRDLQFLRGGSVNLVPLNDDPSLEKSAFLLGALELIDRCRPLGQLAGHRADVDLFAVCEEYVRVLSSRSCSDPAALFFAFEWELLERHGLTPILEYCLNCGASRAEMVESAIWFSPAEGGLVCGECSGQAGAGLKAIGQRGLAVLRKLSDQGLKVDLGKPLDRKTRREVGALLHYFMGYHLPGYKLPVALDLLRQSR